MPYLSREERDAVERDGYRQDEWRQRAALIKKATPKKRADLIAAAKRACRVALDSPGCAGLKEASERLTDLIAAYESEEHADFVRANELAQPKKLPGVLPAGTRMALGMNHGKRFDGKAKLVHGKRVNSMNFYREEPWSYYEGRIGGEKVCEETAYVDWVEFAAGGPPADPNDGNAP